MKSRRGSYTVFLMILFSSVLILIFTVIKVSASDSISSTVNHFGRLWGTSILAEYDLALQKRYCLYGFHGEPTLTAEKLDHFAEYSFQGKSYMAYDGAVCSMDGYELTNPEILKGQIAEAVLLQNRPEPVYRTEEAEETGTRVITSRWILENLPSYGRKDELNVSEAASRIKDGLTLESAAVTTAVNQYILTCFRHCCSGDVLGSTYFRNEVEYILTGQADDSRSKRGVRQKLVLLRNILNLTYLYSSPEKREAAITLAAVLTPGPEAVLTQTALMELWAFAEAENDVNLLYAGEKVPFLKQDRNWALTLENAMNTQEGPVHPASVEGNTYEGYLRVLLSLLSEETRLLRVMDLIQINMKYLYDGAFRLEEYCTGLQFTLKVNGREYEFEESYERPERELSG